MTRNERQKQKRNEAKMRDDAWRSLSVEKQMEILRRRPGECKKQLARLSKLAD